MLVKFFKIFLICVLASAGVFVFSQDYSQAVIMPGHLVISEVQIDSIDGTGGTYDDFVELYNASENPIILDGWSIQRATPGSTISEIVPLSGSIPAYGFYLIVRDHADTDPLLKDLKDLLADFSLSDGNSIFLVNNIDEITGIDDFDIIDLLGMMGSVIYFETVAHDNPPDGKSLERKSGEVHNELQGNGWDTDDNSQDFIVRDTPEPQNTQSTPELPEWAQNGNGEDGEDNGDEEDGDAIKELREMREMREEKDIREIRLQDKTEPEENTIREIREIRDMRPWPSW